MRACRPRDDVAVEIEIERPIEFQTIPVHELWRQQPRTCSR
jgi:hypothetical protein